MKSFCRFWWNQRYQRGGKGNGNERTFFFFFCVQFNFINFIYWLGLLGLMSLIYMFVYEMLVLW